jgi:lipopolysaccharide/colanic/teichoic acid biosynthesis glycosyltransferase
VKIQLRIGQIVLAAGDLACFVISVVVVTEMRAPLDKSAELYVFKNLAAFVGLFLVWHLTFYALGLYDARRPRQVFEKIQRLVMAGAINLGLGVGYFYFFGATLGATPKRNLILAVLLAHAGSLGWRLAYRYWFRKWAIQQKVVLLGDGPEVKELRQELRRQPDLGFRLIDSVSSYADIIVAEKAWAGERDNESILMLHVEKHRGASVYTLETFYEHCLGRIAPQRAGTPGWLIEHALGKRGRAQYVMQRIFSIFCAVILLCLASPLIVVISVAILLIDGRPVLFRQRRVGYWEREFELIKFRTMAPGAEKEGVFAAPNVREGYVTSLGRFLRRYRLDEFPQLWNVLRGDLALVGPRPVPPEEEKLLKKEIPNYHLRHFVVPGITGWAQVHYQAAYNVADSYEKFRYDLFYVKYASLPLDVAILLKTGYTLLGGARKTGKR